MFNSVRCGKAKRTWSRGGRGEQQVFGKKHVTPPAWALYVCVLYHLLGSSWPFGCEQQVMLKSPYLKLTDARR